MNKIDFYPGPQFLLHEYTAIKGICPSNGFEQGGEIITVNGAGFSLSPDASCRFGLLITRAVILNSIPWPLEIRVTILIAHDLRCNARPGRHNKRWV
jgi:hypothetical protein